MFKDRRKPITIILSHILFLVCLVQPASAQSEEEMRILRMFYEEEELVTISAARIEKPVSQVAENITIITEKDIELMNAHTLADVLNHITGVQLDMRGGVGSVANINIQGSNPEHVRVMIDGVTLNNLSDNFADTSAIPVQNIKRVEIIKGPASSVWGSSLGGVINVVTKSAPDSLKPTGTVSSSYGENNSGDFRADISGKKGSLGYYLSAGRLQSDGFTPNNLFSNNNIYAKLGYDFHKNASLGLSFGYIEGDRGLGELEESDLSFDNEFEYIFSTLNLDIHITDNTGLNISVRTSVNDNELRYNMLSTGDELAKSIFNDTTTGGSIKLVSKHESHSFIVGADYDNAELESNEILSGRKRQDTLAIFANDTIRFDKLTVIPGIRYDNISTSEDFVSPSLGITYLLNEESLLRADVARGFNSPSLFEIFGNGFFFNANPDLDVEKVWSYQAGVESSVLKYVWFKTTAFRHDVRDAIVAELEDDGTFTSINEDKITRQGFELEMKTIPVYNFTLNGGYIFQDITNPVTDEEVKNLPEYTIDIGLEYDDKSSIRGLLEGHYIWWNAESSLGGKYSSFIWDVNLMKNLYRNNDTSAEVFLTAHNLFDGSQYLLDPFRNPGRWIEAGIRVKY